MRTVRLYLDQPLQTGQVLELDADRSHYLSRVLRVRPGQSLELFNGSGELFLARVMDLAGKQVRLKVDHQQPCRQESPLTIVLAQAVVRGERMDYLLQKATELGATRFELVWTERCEVRLAGKRLDNRLRHWREVVLHAAQQSGRCRLPPVITPVPLRDWLHHDRPHPPLVLHPQAEQGLKTLPLSVTEEITLLIGPEGGFSEDELSRMQAAGCRPVRLGPRILRTETAGPAAITALQLLHGDLG